MLERLEAIISASDAVNRALGRIEPFVGVLVQRLDHPDALARRLVLAVLTHLYKQHDKPKQLVCNLPGGSMRSPRPPTSSR